MTPQDIIDRARHTTNDTGGIRNEDAELLGYVNDGLREISIKRPDLFTVTGDMLCAAEQAEQSLSLNEAQTLVEVIGLVDGDNLPMQDEAVLSAWNPSWRNDTPGTPTGYVRKPGDVSKFYLTPPPSVATLVTVRYVKLPTEVVLTDTITDVPDTYLPALAAYVVHRSEAKDDEHVNSNRAALHYQAFLAAIGLEPKGTP